MFTAEDEKYIQEEFESLRQASLKRCANEEEYQGVIKAFEFANEAHRGVRRSSGDPYIIHPIEVAKIVVQEIGLGYKSIVAALLHDVVEDTEYTSEDIERLFGAKIASLVDGLTKIRNAMSYKNAEDAGMRETGQGPQEAGLPEDHWKSIQAENFKRILLTLNDDIRVILIKLADRLHNMRTIDSMTRRKKEKILSEAMYIYIPLAHRMGLYSLKSEMENIWLKNMEPEAYSGIVEKIKGIVDEKGLFIDKFIAPISQLLKDAGYRFTINKRVKPPYSIWRKMRRKGIPFEQIYDLFAVRIIFEPKPDISERKQCWDIYSMISEDHMSKLDRIRDWVSTPKSNGYEALHCTLMSDEGSWVEVQIRSERMNQIAEKGIAAHWSYKGISKSEYDIDNWLNMVRGVLESPDVNALEFLDSFHEGLLASEIFVFTPKGDSRSLPKGSTALDFAYSIHTQIGNHALAAKVNLKLVPLSQELKNGDQIEIITAQSQKPQREWLDYTHSPKTRNLIYEALKADIKDSIKEGQTMLEGALERLGVKLQLRVIKKLLLEFKLNNKDELYSKIAAGVVPLDHLEEILKKNNENKFVDYWKLQLDEGDAAEEENGHIPDSRENSRPEFDREKDYLLQENPLDRTLSYRVAGCCRPIPGDAIIGFLDEHNNVVVHKKSCPEAIALASRDGGRIINAKWAKHTILSFLVRINIKGLDRQGIVNDLSQCITLDLNANIRKMHFETHDGIFEGYVDLYVHDTDDLEKMISRIYKIKGIETVTRTDVKE